MIHLKLSQKYFQRNLSRLSRRVTEKQSNTELNYSNNLPVQLKPPVALFKIQRFEISSMNMQNTNYKRGIPNLFACKI